MAKKGSKIEELTKVFSEILKVSKQYAHLWNEGFVEGNSIGLAWGWIAQDERFSIGVYKEDNKFKIDGKNFGPGYDAKGAAKEIVNHWSEYNIKSKDLRKHFYANLQKPLGEYLAKKELGDLVK